MQAWRISSTSLTCRASRRDALSGLARGRWSGVWNGISAPPVETFSTNQNIRRVSTSQDQEPGQERVRTSACEM